MQIEQYLNERVDNQIKWYDTKSKTNQKRYKYFRILEIVFASLIPFFSGYIYMYELEMTITVGILGVLITVIAGVLTLCKYHEKWINYRIICENLKKEKYLFLASSTPYDCKDNDPFKLFVKNIEILISSENSDWHLYMSKDKKKEE